MTEPKPESQKPEVEEERLRRPDEEIKDLDAPPEESDEVRGGYAKFEIEYKPEK
jgi:hypothetical protein